MTAAAIVPGQAATTACGESCLSVIVRDFQRPCAPHRSTADSFHVEVYHCDGAPLVWKGINFGSGIALQPAGGAGGKIQGQFDVPQGCYLVRASAGPHVKTDGAWVTVAVRARSA